MEIAQNISSTCPAAYQGVSGAMFMNAVATLLAVHCSFQDNIEWPQDQSKKVLKWTKENMAYDFIVVGAGTAGSYLASKLVQQFPSQSILLIEAGDNPPTDTEIPGLVFLTNITDIDWSYKTNPNKKICLGYKDGSCIWNKGKAMGGSTSINAMLYTRGHPNDYLRWGTENSGWDYDSLQQHFENIEKFIHFQEHPEKQPLNTLFALVYTVLGIKETDKKNIEALTGTGNTNLLIKNGKRFNTAKVSLNEVKNNDNFNVMKNTVVEQVIIDPVTKTAIGVKIRHNGKVTEIKARKEIILSAGSIETPKILMLSGIGPKEHLSKVGIKTLVNLPVGKNLQDHATVGIIMAADEKYSTNVTPVAEASIILQYMLTRAGHLGSIGVTDFMAFLNVKDKHNPDIQFLHNHIFKGSKLQLQNYHKNIGLKDEISQQIIEQNKKNDIIGIYPTILHPKSRGNVQLRDANPLVPPIVNANYFNEKKDLDLMIESIKKILTFQMAPSFQTLNIKWNPLKIKECGDFHTNNDKYLECYVRHLTTTVYHPVGTAKMGPDSDKKAVVSNELKVYGVKNLRVADASIMPTITGGNTMGPTLMIADKAYHLIKQQYKVHGKDPSKDEL